MSTHENTHDNARDATPVVAIVDDDDAVRDGLALLLRTVGLRTRCYADASAFLEALDDVEFEIACVLLDIRMPGMSGLDLLGLLGERCDFPVIVLTGHGSVDACRRAFKQGALDFLRKPVDDDELIDAVQQAVRAQRGQRERDDAERTRAARLATLSVREREVLENIVRGLSNKEIARELGLSPRTVETYRANVFLKLEVDSLVDLVRDYAALVGMPPP
ncbi:Response regulator protein TmoT [Paraburkholderia caffeinitolerans]|uniref:Response regulator protein TmoT n=1 Tax=Paraburkholderia caffeinitolerans TaxID=1723730 RepID=A0A6J5GRJ2_9BURK|nr:response regulator [Paraburkholderia caffeinitolerans]CAB3805724.1 Response regulator protein TmoT [Paraburkholderia caffeinitolerans]